MVGATSVYKTKKKWEEREFNRREVVFFSCMVCTGIHISKIIFSNNLFGNEESDATQVQYRGGM